VTSALAGVDLSLCLMVVMLIQFIIVVRATAIHRKARYGRLRPGAEAAVAGVAAGGGGIPAPQNRAERAVLLDVAMEALADLQGSERAQLISMLRHHGYPAEAAAGLRAGRRAVRRRAAETLAAIATPDDMPALTEGLGDRDDLVRATCARVLAEVGGPEVTAAVVAAVLRTMTRRPGPATAVVLAIGIHHSAALGGLLGPEVPVLVRATAITVAGQLRLAEHAPALAACLGDRDDLAAGAAYGLGRIGEVRAVPELARLAMATGRAVPARVAAVKALGSIGDPVAVDVVRQQLPAAEWPIAAAAAQALARLGESGLAVLRNAATSPRPELAALAGAALGR
jgi:HEAT repeat protein